MSEYSIIASSIGSIHGRSEAHIRVVAEDDGGDAHEFRIPYRMPTTPDGVGLEIDYERTEHTFGPHGEDQTETIACPEAIKQHLRDDDITTTIRQKADF